MNSPQEAIVLAGGRGSRLGKITELIPKPMITIRDEPFLALLLRQLQAAGVERAVLSVGYLANEIQRYFGQNFESLELEYATESHPLGTGGAVLSSLARCRPGRKLITNADTYLDLDFGSFVRFANRQGGPAIVSVQGKKDSRYGVLVQGGERWVFNGKALSEPSSFVNAGVYFLGLEDFHGFSIGEPFSLETEFLEAFSRRASLANFLHSGRMIDFGTLGGLAEVRALLN